MECNKEEAIRAKNIAENKMINHDFESGRKFALKAQKLYPELESISQMLAVCEVHCAAKRNINAAAKDLYGILQVESLADIVTIKKQYRKLALILHPDKNHFPGAEAAFKLICEANMVLSDEGKRSLHDSKCRDSAKSTTPRPQDPQSCQANGHQQAQSDLNSQPPFWTICPFCKTKSQYHTDVVNRRIKCSKCSILYTAIDIDVCESTQTPHSGHAGMQNVNLQEKAKVKTAENGDLKTEGDATGGVSNGENVEFSKKRSSREEVVEDSTTVKRSNQKKTPADSDSEDDLEPVYVEVPESEFSNFDKDKEEDCFAVDQIWAVYDTIDGMPRFYAQIRQVYSSEFKLRVTWLEADPKDLLEKHWAQEGLPVSCGKFKRGNSEDTKDRLMFSHQMAFEKGSKRFSFVIYPKKGEIWALFKDWNIAKWSSDPENHMKYKFEIVEILSDFDKNDGILVGYLAKVKGFVSLFQKRQVSETQIPSSDLFRFSHRIPSLKLIGNERRDVPAGSYELDTASLPDDLDQFYFSDNVKVKTHENNVKSKGQSTGEDDDNDDDVRIIFTKSPSPCDRKKSIHNFSLDKQNWNFEVGQIWAVGRSKNVDLRFYVQIKKIESNPHRLHVDMLEPCSDAVRSNACGIYKASANGRQILHQQDSFSYLVKAEVNGRNRFNIFPRKKDIWVLYKKKQDFNCAFADLDVCDCDIVEVVEDDGDIIIKAMLLTHVGGYKSVFKGGDRVVEVPIGESHRFLYQIPAVLLTDEEDGLLRGFWELDLAEFPGLVPR